jgi:hypothetical protein
VGDREKSGGKQESGEAFAGGVAGGQVTEPGWPSGVSVWGAKDFT